MSDLSKATLQSDRFEITPFTGTLGSGGFGATLEGPSLDGASRATVGVLAFTIFSFGLGLSLACFSMVWYIASV